jgi:predicted lipoprotein with Yx(FWY)xxD motif
MSSARGVSRHRAIWGGAIMAAAALLVVVAMTALAGAAAKPLSVAKNTVKNKSEPIVVTAKGFAVYHLAPETPSKPLCTSSMCLHFWPPVTVKGTAPKTIAGIKGKLTTWHRKGFTQLVLNGKPLYHFLEDTTKGAASGEGIANFGGTWHVFKEAKASKSGASSSSSTSTTSSTSSSTPPGS